MLLTVASASERSLPARATEGQKLGHLVEKAKDSGLTTPDAIKATQINQPQGRPVELMGESACQAENKQLKSELAALKNKYAALEENTVASAGKGIVAKTLKDSEQSARLGDAKAQLVQKDAQLAEFVHRDEALKGLHPSTKACIIEDLEAQKTCKSHSREFFCLPPHDAKGRSLGEKLFSGGQESAAVTEYVWSLERRLRLVAEQPQDFACSVATKLKDSTCKQRKGSAGNTQGHSAGHGIKKPAGVRKTLAKKTPEKKTDRGDSHASNPERSVQECERVDTNGKSTWKTRKCHKECQGGCDNRQPIQKGSYIAKNSKKIAEAKRKGKKSWKQFLKNKKNKFLYDGCHENNLRHKCTGCLPSRPVLVPASRDGKVGKCYTKRSFRKGIRCNSEYGGLQIDPKRPFNCVKRAYVSTNFYVSEEQRAQLLKEKLQPQKLQGDFWMSEVTCAVNKNVTCDGSVPKKCTNGKKVSCVKVCPWGHKRKGKYFWGTWNRRSKGKCLTGAKGCLPSMCTTIGTTG